MGRAVDQPHGSLTDVPGGQPLCREHRADTGVDRAAGAHPGAVARPYRLMVTALGNRLLLRPEQGVHRCIGFANWSRALTAMM
jgi:hypothetical protein